MKSKKISCGKSNSFDNFRMVIDLFKIDVVYNNFYTESLDGNWYKIDYEQATKLINDDNYMVCFNYIEPSQKWEVEFSVRPLEQNEKEVNAALLKIYKNIY